MGRKFRDMQTEEQKFAARAQQSSGSSSRPVQPADHATWRGMTVNEQAAHLCRLDGNEKGAREFERMAQMTPEDFKAREYKPLFGRLGRFLGRL